MIGKEGMIEKAMMVTAFSFVLSNFGPIDNWLVLHSVLNISRFGKLDLFLNI